ncbi:hypothetical protein EV44_g2438 [Erysiphe necator]|uniref:Uncharacterized protein n=1 Tax=Uncinula necator TaxID=52586 RepID=A0A0B1P346_UNCNE|nr:hypothetical protein EV44_g2438 [Erysiphe necator]
MRIPLIDKHTMKKLKTPSNISNMQLESETNKSPRLTKIKTQFQGEIKVGMADEKLDLKKIKNESIESDLNITSKKDSLEPLCNKSINKSYPKIIKSIPSIEERKQSDNTTDVVATKVTNLLLPETYKIGKNDLSGMSQSDTRINKNQSSSILAKNFKKSEEVN